MKGGDEGIEANQVNDDQWTITAVPFKKKKKKKKENKEVPLMSN